MYIDRCSVVTWEIKLCSVCLLTECVLLQGRVSYVLYVYRQSLRFYMGEEVMFCMCIDRGCVVTWESKLCSVCVLTEGAL